jgi:hypothetical protein
VIPLAPEPKAVKWESYYPGEGFDSLAWTTYDGSLMIADLLFEWTMVEALSGS